MIFNILLAFIFAKIKGYKIKPIMKAYSLYPFVILEIVYLLLQLSILLDNYSYVKYAGVFGKLYLFTLLIPIFVYKLYKPGIIGSVLIIIGTLLNKFVMYQNGGKMPVYATLSKITGYYDEAVFQTADKIHTIGNETTKFKFLTDFIDVGTSILSIGDLLIHFFVFIVIYYTLKEINANPKNT